MATYFLDTSYSNETCVAHDLSTGDGDLSRFRASFGSLRGEKAEMLRVR